MVVIPRPSGRFSRAHPVRSSGAIEAMRRVAAGLLLSAAVISGVILLISAALLAYGIHHRDSMFTGTSSAGVDLSGMTIPEARVAMQDRLDVYLLEPIEVTHDGVVFTATPEDLGVVFDVDATIQRAYDFGRQGSLWHESRNWLDALAGGYAVTPLLAVDPATFAAYMAQYASSLAVAPRQPALIITESGEVTIAPGEDGLSVDVAATFEVFREQAMVMSSSPVQIVTAPVAPAEVDPQLASTLEQSRRIAGEPLQLSLNGTVWEISTHDLFAMLRFESAPDGIDVDIDRGVLRSYIAALRADVFMPGRDAAIENQGASIVITPAQTGQQLDVEASVTLALQALEQGRPTVELATTPVAPNITDSDVAAAAEQAAAMINTPLTVTWPDGSSPVDPHFIATALSFDINAGRNPKIVIKIDEHTLSGSLAPVAPGIRVEPRNAELRWLNGQVTMRRPEDAGRELDVAATTAGLSHALRTGQPAVAAVTRDVLPEVNGQMASTIQFPDVLASGRTEYGSSSADRYHNVELAANRLNGAMVPPGGIFSFNEAVGEVTFDSGYRTGYGIIATNGIISTIPSVGGGICQVATTVFHAAFRAGMPIERRSWHLYWIPRYGQPPSGMKGLDATVDADYNLDFKFRNASDNWIAIVTRLDGSNLTFELVGTNPGWEVQIDEPIITNIRPASQEMVYEENASLPAGTRVFVETAHEGFDATIHRVVRHNGEIIDEVSLFSTYAPSRNVTLVGTGS